MRRHILLYIIILLTVCFLFGCFSFSKPEKLIRYYTLEYAPPKIEGLKSLPVSIFIERFHVAPLYDSTRIMYRSNKYQRESYNYHRWRTNPGDMVTQLLARDFKESSLFKAVYALDKRFPSSHVLKGTIEEFYENDDENWESILTLNVALIRTDKNDPLKSIVFQKKYSIKEVCTKKNPQALAEALSKSLEKMSRLIITDTYSNLVKQKR